ncbi:lipid kinase [Leptolyngbya ohadii]|uniref:lipid kinase n=1 Tax=Leptolyngbya ohadii TaxID=1962290 RepID=UPI000B59D6B4|nr:lipid kinase [Leptolyngbya ohadii]
MVKRTLLLINPHSRRGTAFSEQVRQSLEAQNLDLIPVEATPDRFPEVIREYQHQVDCVIVGGGDGSVNAAIAGLLETQLPVGVLPLGTANNLARTLGISTDLDEACRTIAQGKIQAIDLGWVNGHYFFNVAGIGLSANINQQVEKHLKRKWGVIAYAMTALKLVFKQRRLRAEIHCNGEVIHVKTYQITVCNGRYYGSGLTVAADAAIDDQRLDLCSLEIQHWWQIVWVLRALTRGRYAAGRGIRILHSQEFTIYTRKVTAIDTDGEITTQTPAEFKVIPQAIRVLVPES